MGFYKKRPVLGSPENGPLSDPFGPDSQASRSGQFKGRFWANPMLGPESPNFWPAKNFTEGRFKGKRPFQTLYPSGPGLMDSSGIGSEKISRNFFHLTWLRVIEICPIEMANLHFRKSKIDFRKCKLAISTWPISTPLEFSRGLKIWNFSDPIFGSEKWKPGHPRA